MWGSVGDAAPEGAVFTTNTSTLRPSDFAGASGREERFLALHFANHIWTNRTAEVMPTPATDGGVFDTVVQFARDMGMEPVVLKKEQPGYVLNSLLVPFLEAGQRLWADDVADPQNIEDAAASAVRLLCADGRDLATPEGWTDAVASYNRSGVYIGDVHDAAAHYAVGQPPS